jgi:hypothetical protein
MQLAGSLHSLRTGQLEFVERRAGGFQMTLGEMKVNGSGFKVGVTEQELHCG